MSVKSLLAATAAGVALGMLMAPEKGTDTQKKIGESLDKLKTKWNDIKSLKNISAEDLRELRATFKEHIEGLSDDVRSKILQIIESVRPEKEEMKEQPVV